MNYGFHKIKMLLLFLFQVAALTGAAQEYGSMQNVRIGYKQLQYIAAGDTILTLTQAQAYYNAGKFQPSQHPDLNLGIAKDNYWVTFTISNPSIKEKDFFINLENPRLNDVSVYVLKNNLLEHAYRLGDYFPFSSRIIYENFFAFPVHFDDDQLQRIFLFIRHKGNTLQVPIKLLNSNSFHQSIEGNYMVTGITTGVLIITIFFALFFFFHSKSRLFALYGLYAFFLWAWLWSTEGFGFQYLYPNIPDWATRLGPGVSVLAVVFFIACCLQFCKPYDKYSWLHKVLKVLMYVLAGWGILPLLPFIDISKAADMKLFLFVHFLLNIGSILLLVAYLLWVAITKNKLVWYYFAAVSVSMVCSTIIVAKHSGWLDLPVTSGTFMSIGIIIEVILMTAGITHQFYSYKREKEAMLITYLDQQKAITQKILMTEEAERKRIARELHDDIGAGLTRITLMSDAAKNRPIVSIKQIEEIAETCRRLVGNMGEIVWSLNPENNSLELLLSYMREELHKLLEYSGISYNLVLPDDNNLILNNQQRRNILMVAKEAVHNAVKYSCARNINIFASLKNNTLNFIITDDGKGFNETTGRKGNGIKNMRQRIAELGGNLSITSNEETGTTVQFYINIG